MTIRRARRAHFQSLALLPLLLVATVVPASAAPTGTVRYDVSVADLKARKFRVSLQMTETPATTDATAARRTLEVAIPAWSPGYYQILDFEHDITDFQAVDGGGTALEVTKPDERTWAVTLPSGSGTAASSVQVSYDVTAKDAGYGFFGSHLDDTTGYINGASALMYVVGGKELPATIHYALPDGWKLATPLDPATAPGAADTYQAPDYDALIDAPAQMGAFDRLDFTVRGTPFSAVLVGAGKDVDRAGLVSVLRKIADAGIAVFGYAPFPRYEFLFHFAVGSFGGGLEHRNSTVLNVWKGLAAIPRTGADLVAHEYFHAWNVKRVHPAVLGPFDYTQKVRTGALWFAEGVTDYYAMVLPLMAGLTTPQGFEDELADRIRQLQHTPARLTISADEASRKAWEGASMGYGGLSYYLKGSLLGFALDVEIRAATNDAKGLDDVMRYLDREYGQTHRGYPEDALQKAVSTVSGKDFTGFFDRYVRGTEEIPWRAILRDAGLAYEAGGKTPWLGVSTTLRDGNIVVEGVAPDSPAAKAGLKDGDQLVSVNGEPTASPEALQSAVRRLRIGHRAELRVRRSGKTARLIATVGGRDDAQGRIVPLAGADARALRVRAGLLRQDRPASAASASATGRRE